MVWHAIKPHLVYALAGSAIVSLLHGAFLIDFAAALNRFQQEELASRPMYWAHEATPFSWFLITVAPTAFFMLGWLGHIEAWDKDNPDYRAQVSAAMNEENGRLPGSVVAGVSIFNFLLLVAAPFAICVLSQIFYDLFH